MEQRRLTLHDATNLYVSFSRAREDQLNDSTIIMLKNLPANRNNTVREARGVNRGADYSLLTLRILASKMGTAGCRSMQTGLRTFSGRMDSVPSFQIAT